MARSNNQKAKILYLERMLRETGENRAVSMQEILENLLEKGIRAERKSIYDDMEVLRSLGMNIQYRREKPSGYFLTGRTVPEKEMEVTQEIQKEDNQQEECLTGETEKKEKPIQAESSLQEEKQLPDREGWKKAGCGDAQKLMRLWCAKASMEEVHGYFGDSAEYKEKENGEYVVTTPLLEDKNFYGWLTAMGRDVHLQKPKKAVQAYREYLKMLAKDYKQ